MTYYKIDPLIIEVVARLYMGDYTEIYLEQQKLCDMPNSSGIRQGCTLSPLLFVMLMNVIIKRLLGSGLGFRNNKVYIPVLFYAYDGLVMTNSRREMEKMMKIIEETAMECGLQINTTKSECIIINKRKICCKRR